MNILFAYTSVPNENEFVRLHIAILQKLGYTVFSSKEEFWNPSRHYDFVVINWPDYFYRWRTAITDEEVAAYNGAISKFKESHTKILTFFHDEYSHFGRAANLNLLFDISYGKADYLIHLGNYSKNKYEKIYDNAVHVVIPHPIFKSFQLDLDRSESRKKLGIKNNETLVIVPGVTRKQSEVDFCIRVFKKLNRSNKKLIFIRTSFLSKPAALKSFVDFKSWIYYLLFKNKYNIVDHVFVQKDFLSSEKMSSYFSAADVVIIPRTDILNSGNITLAAQFGVPIIGTGVGNMGELLESLDQNIIPQSVDAKSESLIAIVSSPEDVKSRIESVASDETLAQLWKNLLRR